MDGYQFIASLVAALAWPTAAFAIAAIQHRPVGRLIDRIKSAKLLGAEIGIGDEIAAVREKIESEPIPLSAAVEALPAPTELLSLAEPENARVKQLTDELAVTSATGAIVAAWRQLEDGLKAIAETYHLEWHPANFAKNIESLKRHGVLTSSALEAVNALRRIRNEVVHARGASPSLEEAASYRATVQDILDQGSFNAIIRSR